MPRKKVEEPPKGAPLWCLTYGDMVTNVLIFFVLLFAFSEIDKSKYLQIANSLRGALGGKQGVLMSGSAVMQDAGGEQTPSVITEEFSETMTKLEEDISKNGQSLSGIEIYQDERGLVISFKEKLFFDIGKAYLRPVAQDVLSQVGDTLRDDQHRIRVEGHTCDLPIRTSAFPSNWELSAARATNVARFLIEQEAIPAERMSVAGYAQYRPIVENVNEANRARNRRVDIVLLSDTNTSEF